MIVYLGSMIHSWCKAKSDLPSILTFLVELRNFLSRQQRSSVKIPAWIILVASVAEDITKLTGESRADAEKLIELGRRIGISSLISIRTVDSAFGLRHCQTRLALLRGSIEDKIECIRNQSFEKRVRTDQCFIAYTPDTQDQVETYHKAYIPGAHDHQHRPDWQNTNILNLELATLRPQKTNLTDGTTKRIHRRWIPANEIRNAAIPVWRGPNDASANALRVTGLHSILTASAQRLSYLSANSQDACGVYTIDQYLVRRHDNVAKHLHVVLRTTQPPLVPIQISSQEWKNYAKKGLVRSQELKPTHATKAASSQGRSLHKWFSKAPTASKPRSSVTPHNSGDCSYGCPEKFYALDTTEASTGNGNALIHNCLNDQSDHYTLVYPFSPDIALYQQGDNLSFSHVTQEATLDDLIHAIQNDAFDAELLGKYLESGATHGEDDRDIEFCSHLDALVTASRVYSNLKEAYVELSIASKPFKNAKWITGSNDKISRGQAFSCIAWFENNGLDIEPTDLQQVMAVSLRDSLFVAEALARDPYDQPKEHIIRRVVGNIGRSGMAFLVSPSNLVSEKPNYASWRLINHVDYNGLIEDNFRSTSLHLGFTGYELPLDTRDKGFFDVQCFFLETVVRAFDRGKWVADINPLTIYYRTNPWPEFKFDESRVKFCQPYCKHNVEQANDFSKLTPLSSVDSWNELLDVPSNTYIIKANGNWLARLAIAALESTRLTDTQRTIMVVQDRICWTCIEQESLVLVNDNMKLVVLC